MTGGGSEQHGAEVAVGGGVGVRQGDEQARAASTALRSRPARREAVSVWQAKPCAHLSQLKGCSCLSSLFRRLLDLLPDFLLSPLPAPAEAAAGRPPVLPPPPRKLLRPPPTLSWLAVPSLPVVLCLRLCLPGARKLPAMPRAAAGLSAAAVPPCCVPSLSVPSAPAPNSGAGAGWLC